MAYRDYSTAHGHIVDASGQGDFTTLSAAMVAAVAGDTIFIRPGTYGGGFNLTPGVNICSFGCEGFGGSPPNVEITGTLTLNNTGTVNISGLSFNVSANALVLSGSFTSILNVDNCYFTMNTSTGINMTNSNAQSQFNLSNCRGNLGTNTVAVYAHSGTGTLSIVDSDFTNFGSSTATSANISGSVVIRRSSLQSQVEVTAMGTLFLDYVTIDTSGANVPAIIASGVATTVFDGFFNTGTADAVQISTNAAIFQCFVDSSSANAITGGGTLFYTNLIFGSTNTITVSTQIPQDWKPYSTAGTTGSAVRGTSGFDSTYFTSTGGFVTKVAPVASAVATPAFGTTLTLGTPIQNTLGYDILVNVNIETTAATGATIIMGVGPTSTPSTNTVTGTFSGIDIISFSAIVPNNYYLLVDSTGAITTGSITLQTCAL